MEPTTAKEQAALSQPASNMPYVMAIVFMTLITVLGVVIVSIFVKGQDAILIGGLIFSSAAPTTLALLAYMKSQETHLSVNSRMDAFMKETLIGARAQGRLQGAEEANERTDVLEKK